MDTIILFFAGLFFANGIPHFVHGISGKRFPTPFAKPPGKGLSRPITNVIWGVANFITALILLSIANQLVLGLNRGFIAFAAGFIFASIGLAFVFQHAEKDGGTA